LCWPERDIFKTARQRLASTVVAHLKSKDLQLKAIIKSIAHY
jgi:hypothetical protein